MSEHIKTTVNTIEQAIQILSYNEHWWEGFQSHGKDIPTLRSLAESPYAYTEKQGNLAVALLKRYHTLFMKWGLDLTQLLEKPVFDRPFRVIDYTKSIEAYTENDSEWLEMKFPYQKKIIDLIRTLKGQKLKNRVPMIYDGESKTWKIKKTEVTLYYCVLIAVRYDFKLVTEELLEEYNEVKQEKLHFKKPCVLLENGQLTFKNVSTSLIDWWKQNYDHKTFRQQCDVLKELPVDNMCNFVFTDKSTLTDRIAVSKNRELYLDRNKWTKQQLVSALDDLNSLPLLLHTAQNLNHSREIQEIKEWYEAFNGAGIPNSCVSWGFTVEDAPEFRKSKNDKIGYFGDPYPENLPESDRMELYNLWKDIQALSSTCKQITKETKIIFVRGRIPRSLMKSQIIPKSVCTVFDYSYWPTSTETLGRVVENCAKRIYYIIKNESISWKPHNYEFL
jgi:hypothetical protein